MAGSAKDSKLMEYKDIINNQKEIIHELTALVTSLKKTLEKSNANIANLEEQVAYLTKKLFGTSSEKHTGCKGQLSLFDEAEQEVLPPDESSFADQVTIKGHTRQAKSTQADIFKGLPVEKVVVPLAEEQKHCLECGSEMLVIGRELVRREFAYEPAKGKMIQYYRETAKCPVCSKQSAMAKNIQFVKSTVPEALIPHSYASASAVAWVMYQKYSNAMPLYRQEQDWKQLGVKLSRATLANWIIFCALTYFQSLCDYFHRELIHRQFLMADETRIQVLKESDRAAETNFLCGCFVQEKMAFPLSSFTSIQKRGQDIMPKSS